MIKDKILKGLKVKYDYPPAPPKGISLNTKYTVLEDKNGYKLVAGKEENKLTEQEIRVYFIIDK